MDTVTASHKMHDVSDDLTMADPEIFGAIERELERQRNGLELIASENFVSPAVLAAMGRLEEAIDASTNAWRLGQHEPIRFDTASDLGYAHYLLGNDEAALEWGKQSTALVPEYLQANILLAATYAQLGRLSEGQRHVNSVLALRPDFSCAKHRTRLVYSRTEDRDRITEGLLIAGFSE